MQDSATVVLTRGQRVGVVAAAAIAVLVAVPSAVWALDRLFGAVTSTVPWPWIAVIAAVSAVYGGWTAWRMFVPGTVSAAAGKQEGGR